ncbi:hypothetical protein ACFQJ7_04120 [Halovenus rubra]|uniref:Uncharacterized protein n=2 Tax=Halovenus rubra TaxID=869890 RepID=A0ABD5X5Y8_9EURY|nr:hypothetical protein [Halovenus rubra]
MKMNRRNVLTGLGGLAIGGGALVGSGAFTSVEAERDVEVNVLVENEIGDSEEVADVLVNVGGYETVAADDGTTTSTDGTDFFPSSGTSTYSSPSYGEDYVSLIDNDVTLVFGHSGSELVPNATTSYDNLFALVNSAGSQTTGSHSLSFGNGGFTEPNTGVSFQSPPSGVQIGATSAQEFDVDVTADGADDTSTGELVITIQ